MKYYFVDYLVCEDRQIVEDESIGLPMHNFANIEDFKELIAKMRNKIKSSASVVIKSYRQVTIEEYNHAVEGA